MLKIKICSKCEYLIFDFLISYFCFRHTMDKKEISERCKISLQAAGIRYYDVSGESLLHKKRATV